MSYLDEMSAKIYNQPEFRVKGYRLELEDVFLAKNGGSTFILYIVRRANLNNAGETYSYTLFSPKDNKVVSSEEAAYKNIVGKMPALGQYTKLGGDMDIVVIMQLQETLDSLAESFIGHGSLSADEEKQYREYLKEMHGMQSPDFKKVYAAAVNLL